MAKGISAAVKFKAPEHGKNEFDVAVNVTKLKAHLDKLKKLDEEKAMLNARTKSVYDAAHEEGIDKRALKTLLKESKHPMSTEHRLTVNAYFEALGDLPLFATALAKQ